MEQNKQRFAGNMIFILFWLTNGKRYMKNILTQLLAGKEIFTKKMQRLLS
jgi:hypothetical protein